MSCTDLMQEPNATSLKYYLNYESKDNWVAKLACSISEDQTGVAACTF